LIGASARSRRRFLRECWQRLSGRGRATTFFKERRETMELLELGWDSFFQQQAQAYDGQNYIFARVIEEQKDRYKVLWPEGEAVAEVSGRFRNEALTRADFPAVGDWVGIEPRAGDDRATIHCLLERRTKFSRKEAGVKEQEQIVAANIDTVFVVSSLNSDLNLRRIERYTTLVWESGVVPVVLLTKADLCENVDALISDVAGTLPGISVHALSALDLRGMDALKAYVKPGQTCALLGSSGVGKSTLVNCLAGRTLQAVQEIREHDGKGRHTTTARQLICLPGSGMIIDTPGMREIQVWDGDAGLSHTFEDIETLMRSCRFSDCKHDTEPGCALKAALQSGALDPGRLESFLKLQREIAWHHRRANKSAAALEKQRWRKIHVQQRQRRNSNFGS
jgi:ribosome biogenesis GTPase / thiamine phosphate phosphatase